MTLHLVNTHKETIAESLCNWILNFPDKFFTMSQFSQALLDYSDTSKTAIRQRECSSYISQCRFILEREFGITIIYNRQQNLYYQVKRGSVDASRFTIQHYRRATLMAARAQELNDLGFLNPAHVDELIEEVFCKVSRRTKELSSLKTALLSKWRLLKKSSKIREIAYDKKTNVR